MNSECKYQKKLSAISYWLLAFVFCSCHKAPLCDCIDSAGSQATITKNLGFFNQIYVKDNINVYITIGSPETITVEGGSNLIKNIETDVNNGILSMKNNNICNWLRSYKKSVINVYITMPELNTVTNAGYGTVYSRGTLAVDSLVLNTVNSSGDFDLNVNCNYINAHMFGTADLTLTGYAKTFSTNFFGGTGFIYNNNLETGYTFVSSSTTGDCYVNADSALVVEIFGEGDVYYKGNPAISYFPKGGSGKLVKD